MKKLTEISRWVFTLLVSTVAMAEKPQNGSGAGRALPSGLSEPDRLMPDATETPRLTKWRNYHYGLFIHFNMNTYGKGQHPGPIPASAYQPVKLDVDSWVRLAKVAGMRYAVLTVKHDTGFCLWDSKVIFRDKEFDYDVAATDYKTDVVQAFVEACQKYGIAPGFYYCLADTHADKRSLQEMFHGRGEPMADETFQFIKAQLSELTAKYPACEYYWLDVPHAVSVAQQGEIYDLLRRANPNKIVLMNQHLAKNADGAQDLLEKQKGIAYPVDVLDTEASHQIPRGKVSNVQYWNGKKFFMGYEHCDIAGEGWFKTKQPKSVEALFEVYKKIRLAGGNLLLDVGPTPAGVMPDGFQATLIELKRKIDQFEGSLNTTGEPTEPP